MLGAREALEPLLDVPGLDFRMARVLIDMLDADSVEAAQAEAGRVSDARATAFHDAERLLGRSTARRLGWEREVAWDIFLVYGPSAAWTDADIPAPDEWFHQLDDGESTQEAADDEGESSTSEPVPAGADPARFRTGEDLLSALEDAIREAAADWPRD